MPRRSTASPASTASLRRPEPKPRRSRSSGALAAVLALALLSGGLCSAADVFVRGRVNPDESVDIADAVFVLLYLFAGGEQPVCLEAADIDDDGAVDISDPIVLLGYLFMGGPGIPPPYPDAGVDPSADGLSCSGVSITEIRIAPSPVRLAAVGETIQLAVAGMSASGDIDLHASARGTLYATSAAAVAGVYRDGLVEARAPGNATITVRNGDVEATVAVIVQAIGGSSRHRVLAVNDLGMHCMDTDFSIFTILPPFNVLHAQVARSETGGRVTLLGASDVEVRYAPIPDPAGSVNSRSVAKTGFWDTAAVVFGAALEPGQGLLGRFMPDDAPQPGPQPFAREPGSGWFAAAGIPITPLDDAGGVNAYPLLRVTAYDRASGQPLAHTDVVTPVSQEIDCKGCHATGEIAASAGFLRWWHDADLEVQSKKNILTVHDYRSRTALLDSTPLLCGGCHYSAALDLAGTGPSAEQARHRTMSGAMHSFHGVKTDGAGAPLFPPGAPPEATCYRCHPGKVTRCERGAMRTGGMECADCHGEMLAVGGEHPLLAGGSLDGLADGDTRRPWIDMPRCQSCHTGDAVSRLTGSQYVAATDGIRLRQAYRAGDASASPILAANKRFAENDKTLYRFSRGHGGVLCENCHGSVHAEWPNDDASHNDNIAPAMIQGHGGVIAECTACHAPQSVALGLGGPHGLHVVNDMRWVKEEHGHVYERQSRECRACHGEDLGGTVLSRAAADRTFRIEDNQTVRIAAGTQVSCTLCHSWPRHDD